MDSNIKRIVNVATTQELKDKHYYLRLWIAARNIKLSRRAWLDELADCFRDHYNSISIIHNSGEPYILPETDEIMGDDPEGTWMGDYLKSDPYSLHPKTISRKWERLQYIDLYFRTKHPDIARHFGR